MNRTNKELCLLCESNPADQVNSHIVPAGLMKHMIGKRDYEESYFINSRVGKIDKFFGRSNLKNSNSEKKEHHHTEDFWFCNNCEKRFSYVENIVLPIINNKIRKTEYLSKLGQLETNSGNKYFKIFKDKATIELFFYSILWRLCIKYRLLYNKQLFSSNTEKKLKNILNNNLPAGPNKQIKMTWEGIPYIILTLETDNINNTFIFSDDRYQNPNLFFITDFVILFFQNGFSKDFEKDEFNLSKFLDSELLIRDSGQINLGIIDSDHWKDIVSYYTNEISTKALLENWIVEIAKKRNITFYLAAEILQNRTREIFSNGKKNASESYQLAFIELMEDK